MPLLWFSLARLGLFVLALAGLYWAGLGGWLWIVVAAVVAWTLSYVLLGDMRSKALRYLARRPRQRLRPDDTAEDALAPDNAPGTAPGEVPGEAAGPGPRPGHGA